MRTYEVLFILSPQLTEDDTTSLITEFKGVAEKSGAKLTNEEAWGRRRLAYPIEKSNEGIYHLFVFEGEGTLLSELDRKMRNSDRVLRHLISRVDLDHKRAAKLAKRNPKKERTRAVPAQPMAAPMQAAPAAAPSAPPVQTAAEAAPAEPPVQMAEAAPAPAELPAETVVPAEGETNAE